MVAFDARSSLRGLATIVSAIAVLTACASTPPKPDPASEASATPPQTVAPPSAIPPTPEAEEPVAVPVERRNTVVIEEGGNETEGKTLGEVAEEERARRREAPPSVVVVTDKNLQEHATGKLTFSSETSAPPGELEEGSEEDRERYWRDRVRDHRREWATAVEDILRLQQEVSELRLRFYAEDDPYVRDGRIKPQWDRALDELGDARRRAERLEEGLDDVLDEGRRAGAMPGWLREGSELEPEERPYGESLEEDEDEAVIGEPQVVEENRR